MKQIKTISIKCETKDRMKLDELSEFQGQLKKRDDSDVDKIVKSIREHGFCCPFHVWQHEGKNYLLDGHGRYKALRKLDELGFIIPDLPVNIIECKDEKSARDLLLRINSQYGKMTAESVLDFIGDFDIDLSNFELPDGVIKFDATQLPEIDFGDEPEKVSKLGVLVSCDTESEMEEVFQQLRNMGLKCKMVE